MLWKTIAAPKKDANCRCECAYPQCNPNPRENRQRGTERLRELLPSVRKTKTNVVNYVPMRTRDQRNVRQQRDCCSCSYSENWKGVTPPPFHGAPHKSTAARGEYKNGVLVKRLNTQHCYRHCAGKSCKARTAG